MPEEGTTSVQPQAEAPAPAVEEAVETTTEVSSQEAEQTAPAEATNDTVSEETAESETTGGSEETDGASTEDDPDLAPKSQNRFRKLANENKTLRARVQELEQLKVKTEEDFIDEGLDPRDAEIQAVKADLARRDAVEAVVSLNQTVDTDLERAMREFPILNPQSEQFNEKLASQIMQQYDADAGAEYDPDTGLMIRTSQLPYNYIKSKMDLIGIASAQAKVTAQRNVESMVSASETSTGSAPTNLPPEKETLEQMRERLSNITF